MVMLSSKLIILQPIYRNGELWKIVLMVTESSPSLMQVPAHKSAMLCF